MRGQQVQAWGNTVGRSALWYKMVENWTGISALGCTDTLVKNWLADAGFDEAIILETFGWRRKAAVYQYHTQFWWKFLFIFDLLLLYTLLFKNIAGKKRLIHL